MKSYSIGRDESCNIVVQDASKVVSRHHATINVDGRKITIVDNSSNGTYINGIKISSGIPVPVTRKDVVSFANAVELDWKTIPNKSRTVTLIAIAIVFALIAAGLGAYFILSNDKQQQEVEIEEQKVSWTKLGEQIDSLKKDISSITVAYSSISDTLKTLKVQLESKDVSDINSAAKAESIKKNFWQIEDAINRIDPNILKKSLDSVIQSYDDKVPSTSERVENLEKTISECKASLEKAYINIKDASEAIAALKEKVKPQAQKKVEKQQDVIIVGM